MHFGVNDGDNNGARAWDIYNRAAVICQLESGLGAENAEAICAVEGGELSGYQVLELVRQCSGTRSVSTECTKIRMGMIGRKACDREADHCRFIGYQEGSLLV
jgi:hypothetical protein